MFSIIICSIDDNRYTAMHQRYTQLLRDKPHEFIRIKDAKSLAEGYNRGIDQSRGENLVFSHDDVDPVAEDFFDRLEGHLQNYDLVGIAGTTKLIHPFWPAAAFPYIFGQVANPGTQAGTYDVVIFNIPAKIVPKVQAMDGLFFAARRRLVEKIRFDAATFDAFHFYDIDFTFSAYLAGFATGIACDMPMIHASRGSFDQEWQKYAIKFASKYQGKFQPGVARPSGYTGIGVSSRAELLEVMRPDYLK